MGDIAVVFSGGGAKGAYSIGVWKALNDLNVLEKVKVISATSIGAINAVLAVKGDIDAGINFWNNIRRADIAPMKIREIRKMIIRGSLFDKYAIDYLLESNLDMNLLMKSDIDILVTCTNIKYVFPKKEVYSLKDYDKETIKDIIISSCCIPLAFKHHKINDKGIYFDGGIVSRTPIEALKKRRFDKIVVIHLDKFGRFNRLKYRGENVKNIYPSKYLGGILMGTYGFIPELNNKRIMAGYNDAIKELKGWI